MNNKSLEHILIVNNIKDNSINITILSNPINLLLVVGQSVKINLTSSNYYDLYVKLDSIENNKAKLTIRTINEEIPKINPDKVIDKSLEKPGDVSLNNPSQNNNENNYNIEYIIIIIIVIILLILVGILILLVIKNKTLIKKEKNIKEYKSVFDSHIKPK